MADQKKPNIVMIMADDVGTWNLSAYHRGMMGGSTPNIDRIAREGALFTDYYGQQSCTAGEESSRLVDRIRAPAAPAPARFPLENRVLLNEALHGVVHRRVVERQPPQHQLAAEIYRADPA
jgi:hypothetical protein